jgi:uncharacterized membrane protein (UPF0127 family)
MLRTFKRRLFLILLPLLVLGALDANEQRSISICTEERCHSFLVEVADTQEKRAKGLMHRHTLARFSGMLFIYPFEHQANMWMKNTHIPLDMLFIDKNNVIVQIEKNTKPFSQKVISSQQPIKAVLEINGSLSDELKIKVNDVIKLSDE